MNYLAAIDVSIFVWDKDDFKKNKKHYYELIKVQSALYEQIRKNRIKVLLRGEALSLILNKFPYEVINQLDYDYGVQTLRFLTNCTQWPYDSNSDVTVVSEPNLCKPHFGGELHKEIQSMVCHMYYLRSPESKYISYPYFWNHKGNLTASKNGSDIVNIDTLIYKSEEDIIYFFEKYRIKFKHNPKHNHYNAGGKISALSCFNDRAGDTAKAQMLLDSGTEIDGDIYNYDNDNKTYVVFVKTSELEYHGWDVSTLPVHIQTILVKIYHK